MTNCTAKRVNAIYAMTGRSVMVNSDASIRTQVNRPVGRLRVIRPLTKGDIPFAISYRDEAADNRHHFANAGVVILLIVNVVAFATLFAHVAIR